MDLDLLKDERSLLIILYGIYILVAFGDVYEFVNCQRFYNGPCPRGQFDRHETLA
jgi:hypothetical protein